MTLELEGRLKQLGLLGMARDYALFSKDCEKSKKSYAQYLEALVDSEILYKEQVRVERFKRDAKIPLPKLANDFDFSCRTGISGKEVSRLCTGEFIRSFGNVVFYGGMGVGKTHLAMAITRALCEKGFRCFFTNTTQLINDLIKAQKEFLLGKMFKHLDRYDLLTIDELGYTPQNVEGTDLFFQLISHRYERKSLLITTNLTFSEWEKVFINPLSTAAAVDRIIHNCETFNIKGPSWRAESAKRRKSLSESQKEVAKR